MPAAPIPSDEPQRLAALAALNLLGTEPEERFDRITRMAVRALGVANAAIHLVGEDRLFAKSRYGLEMSPERGASFCAYTILGPDLLVVPDAQADARFADLPQVKGKPGLRFYAGSPICAPDGSRVGTLCVTDRLPRVPSEEDTRALADFALMAQGELNMIELNPDFRLDEAEQERLRLSEARFRDVADVPGSFIWEATLEGKTTFVSERVEEVLGFPAKEILERGFFEGIFSADVSLATAKFFFAIRRGQRFRDLEFRYLTAKGGVIWLAVRGAPLLDAEGNATGFRGYAEDVTARRQDREGREAAQIAAEKAAVSQAEFLGRVSQDIREPVNALIGLSGLLLSGNQLTPELRRHAEGIRDHADRLLAVVTDLNDFAHIESGLLELENHPFELADLVESVLYSVADSAAAKGLELHWHMAGDLPPGFSGDEARLRQVFHSLLVHAVEETDSGDVSIGVERAESEGGDYFVLISIWDTGAGYTPEQIEQLFEIQTGETAEDMGLSISRSLAELMGGRVWVESEPGKGTGYHVAVPLQEALPPDPFVPCPVLRGKTLLIVVAHEGVRTMLENFAQNWGLQPILAATTAEALTATRNLPVLDAALVDESLATSGHGGFLTELHRQRSSRQTPCIALRPMRPGLDLGTNLPEGFVGSLLRPLPYREVHQALTTLFKSESPSRAPAARRNGGRYDVGFARRRPMRILIADDNATNLKTLSGLLAQMGFRPDAAHNGREVLQALERQPYDVVFMDMAMPEMSGAEATAQIRERFTGPRRPWIIAMTAAGAEEDRDSALAAGTDAHLARPIRGEALETELIRASENIGQVVDPLVLSRYQEMTGSDLASMRELADIFGEEALATFDGLRTDIEARRSKEIAAKAVQFSRSCANFGAARMRQLCEGLQAAARSGDFSLAREFLERMQGEFKRVRAALEDFAVTGQPA